MLDPALSITAFPSHPSSELIYTLDVDYSDLGILPEQRLWKACILELIHEYEWYVASSVKHFRETGESVDITKKWQIDRLRHIAGGRDFALVCTYADFPQYKVVRKLDEIATKHELEEVQWARMRKQSAS